MSDVQMVILFAFHTLVAFGAWYAVGYSKISEPFRARWSSFHFLTHGKVKCDGCGAELHAVNAWNGREYRCPGCKGECQEIALKEDAFLLRLIECPACFGFWEGALYSLTVNTMIWGLSYGAMLAPLFACATLATNLILAKKTGLMP